MSGLSDATSSEVPKLELTTIALNPVKLNGTNYLMWSKTAYMAIAARGLLGYINGALTAPDPSDKFYNKWVSENSIVMTYLIGSMEPKIGQGYVLLPDAAHIWTAAKESYSQVGNYSIIFDLHVKIGSLKQKELSVADYYSELRSLWQDLDYYDTFTAACAVDAAAMKSAKDKLRVYTFLAGLNSDFDHVRSQILNREHLPTLEQTNAILQNEDLRRISMMPVAPVEQSALYSL